MSDSSAYPRGAATWNSLEDELWSMSQQSRSLQDLRKDIRHVWDDEAARGINSRYLDPHEQDDERMRGALNEQSQSLESAARDLEAADELAQRADEYAAVATERLRFAEQDMDNAYSHYDLYVRYNSDARSKFPLVHELIDHANASC
jgi:exonuclease VII small subunit